MDPSAIVWSSQYLAGMGQVKKRAITQHGWMKEFNIEQYCADEGI
jgi:hypothetical protein